MPTSNLTARGKCGLFYWTFQNFMSRRARSAIFTQARGSVKVCWPLSCARTAFTCAVLLAVYCCCFSEVHNSNHCVQSVCLCKTTTKTCSDFPSAQDCLIMLSTMAYLRETLAILMLQPRYVFTVRGGGWLVVVAVWVTAVFLVDLLLTCGDIESNPGPVNKRTENTGSNLSPGVQPSMSVLEKKMDQQTALVEGKLNKVLDAITATQQFSQQLESRFSSLEQNFKAQTLELQNHFSRLLDMVTSLENKVKAKDALISSLQQDRDSISNRLESLEQTFERQERYSRRSNMLIYGMQEERRENFDTTQSVICHLQKYFPHKEWNDTDIEASHRLGSSNNVSNRPRPVIVKFHRRRDIMMVMSDKEGRNRMKDQDGLRLGSDLTQQQRKILGQLRQQGKQAYYARGKLFVKDSSSDPHWPGISTRTPSQAQTDKPSISSRHQNTHQMTNEHTHGMADPEYEEEHIDEDENDSSDQQAADQPLSEAQHANTATEALVSPLSMTEQSLGTPRSRTRLRGMGRGKPVSPGQQASPPGVAGRPGDADSPASSPHPQMSTRRMATRTTSQNLGSSTSGPRQTTLPSDWHSHNNEWA